MNILAWVILGFIAGAIAKMLYPGSQGGGFLSDIVLGIIGAVVGGSIASLLTTGTFQLTAASLSIPGIIVAIIGAMFAIFIWESIIKRRSA
ncbi:MAG TPA: GlsB/YeaQ/YmgE family stress response membrane protein [Trichocoleus sp.]